MVAKIYYLFPKGTKENLFCTFFNKRILFVEKTCLHKETLNIKELV